MGNAYSNLENMLGQVVKNMTYLKGVNLVMGKYEAQSKIDGADENLNPLTLGAPTLKFDEREMNGLPIHLYFKIAGDVIKMVYEFRVVTDVDNAVPMLISDLNIVMHVKSGEGKETTEVLSHSMGASRTQVAHGEKTWKSIDEFVALKRSFENGDVYFTWSGKIQWVDVSSEEMKANIKKPDYRPQSQIVTIKDEIQIGKITPDANSYTYVSMFDGVKNLLRWESEILDGKKVYFMDPFKDDAFYFLPQEYRIKALTSNAPDMTTEIHSENGGHKVLMRFRIAPYVHPNAKRDAYKIFQKRKKKEYCELRYGGYESARFEWGGEMRDGKLYGENGFNSITNNGDIEAAPESSFFIVMEAPADGLVKLFQENIMSGGIHIGDVFFSVYDGLENTTKELGPIPVKLNLHKLAALQPHVSITECKWPNYVAKITNTGLYPIEIGGAALSVIRREKNQVKEVKHELRSSAVWPKTLAKGKSMTVELDNDQVEKIKHRRIPLFWKIKEDYWTEYVCEPYQICLPDESLEEIMGKTNESAAYEHKAWELVLISNFNWYDYSDMTAVQVEIKNKFGVNEVVTLTEGGEKPRIPMVPNLSAEQKTQQAGEQVFEYRIRTISKNGPKNPEWGEWMSDSGCTLFIYGDDLSPAKTTQN